MGGGRGEAVGKAHEGWGWVGAVQSACVRVGGWVGAWVGGWGRWMDKCNKETWGPERWAVTLKLFNYAACPHNAPRVGACTAVPQNADQHAAPIARM